MTVKSILYICKAIYSNILKRYINPVTKHQVQTYSFKPAALPNLLECILKCIRTAKLRYAIIRLSTVMTYNMCDIISSILLQSIHTHIYTATNLGLQL